ALVSLLLALEHLVFLDRLAYRLALPRSKLLDEVVQDFVGRFFRRKEAASSLACFIDQDESPSVAPSVWSEDSFSFSSSRQSTHSLPRDEPPIVLMIPLASNSRITSSAISRASSRWLMCEHLRDARSQFCPELLDLVLQLLDNLLQLQPLRRLVFQQL